MLWIRQLGRVWRQELHPRRLLPNLTAGFVAGVLRVIYAISYATLIFAGELSGYTAAGVGITLFGAMVIGVVISLGSSFPGVIASPQGKPVAVLALIAASISGVMIGAATVEQTFFTVVAAILLVSILTGVFFMALGAFKLGGLIRFIPYPVMGGFLAGSGWLLLKGSIKVMTGIPFKFAHLERLCQPQVLTLWLPGLVFSIILFLVLRRYHHFMIVPSMILLGTGLFYLILWLTHTPVAEAAARGWLLESFPQRQLWHPLNLAGLAQADWSVVAAQSGNLASTLIISVISILMTTSALELAAGQEIDLNKELQVAGAASLLAAFGGGMFGYHSLSSSMLNRRMGANSRLVGLISSALCAAMLFFGASVISYLPKPLLGGLIMFNGINFLSRWLIDAWTKLPRSDYFVILLILFVVGLVGFVQGIAVGVIAGVVLFVVNYSRIGVVKQAFTGAVYHSNVERADYYAKILRDNGEQIHILQLQGFIFFGTAHHLFEYVRERARRSDAQPLRFVVLDFRLVNGLDSSAVNSFVKMKRLAQTHHFVLVSTHVSPRLRRQFQIEGVERADDPLWRTFSDLDRGVEWCEDQLLSMGNVTVIMQRHTLRDRLRQALPQSIRVEEVLKYFEQQQAPAGHYLIRQGDAPDSLYFVEWGQVTVQIENADGSTLRLRTMQQGTVVGEVGMYLRLPRTAAVVTDMPSTVYRLDAKSLQAMQENDPRIAAAFHQFMARFLAERLVHANKMVQDVLAQERAEKPLAHSPTAENAEIAKK